MFSKLPNLLTFARIAACPFLVLLLFEKNYYMALMVFIVAGITDGLDGYIAKKFGFVTKLGEVLDPSADKLLIASAYIMLAFLGDIPFWLLILVMFRDLIIVLGFLIFTSMGEDVPMQPSRASKINTFVQILLVIILLVDKAALLSLPLVVMILIYMVTVTTVVSGCQYVWQWGIKREYKKSKASD